MEVSAVDRGGGYPHAVIGLCGYPHAVIGLCGYPHAVIGLCGYPHAVIGLCGCLTRRVGGRLAVDAARRRRQLCAPDLRVAP